MTLPTPLYYHVTTPKKLARYRVTGGILPPVRFWTVKRVALDWMRKTGRTVLLQIKCDESYPLPMKRPARWTPEIVRDYYEIT